MANPKKTSDGMKPNNILAVEQSPNETGAQAMARALLEPQFRHALSASSYASKATGGGSEAPGIMDFVDHVQVATGKAEAGDLAMASRMLAAQAMTLDAMFTELARQAAINMSKYVDAADRYGRLALKAQSNSRATLEALAKLHQPREQTVRHVHVNEGGQAVVADHFHHHAGAAEMPKRPNNPMQPEPVPLETAPRCLAQGDGLQICRDRGHENALERELEGSTVPKNSGNL